MATVGAGFVALGWQVWTGNLPHSYFVLTTASFAVVLVLLLIGWLVHPDRGWLRREEPQAREDRMLRAWTPRGLERKFRVNMVLVGVSLMAGPMVVLAIWIAPSLGIGVPAAWATAANSLLGDALVLLLGGVFMPIAIVFMPQNASFRRRYLTLAEAILWAPEDGVDDGGAREGAGMEVGEV